MMLMLLNMMEFSKTFTYVLAAVLLILIVIVNLVVFRLPGPLDVSAPKHLFEKDGTLRKKFLPYAIFGLLFGVVLFLIAKFW